MRWRAPTRRRKSAASSFQRLPVERPEEWARLLGRKVSLRYRLHDRDHSHSEAIGVVASFDADRLTILTKRGDRVDIDVADVEAGKVFP